MKDPVRILLIDENEEDAMLIEEMLLDKAPDSFTLSIASDLSSGMRKLEGDIDIILLDLGLSDGDGMGGLRRLNEEIKGDIPVIVLSNPRDSDPPLAIMGEGAQDHLVKGTFDGDVLIRSIHYAMERCKLLNQMKEDIYERQEVEGRLRIANRKLELLGSVTIHDLLNQISLLGGYADLLQGRVNDAKSQEYIKKIKRSLDRISRIVEFTKEYEKVQQAGEPEWITLHDLVNKVASLMDLDNLDIEIMLEGVEVKVDQLFDKVVYNIIDNAIEHGGDISRIRVGYETRGDLRIVFFENDGEPIPPNVMEHLFEHGFGEGKGYGLFLCKEILSANDIGINIENRDGWVRFELSFPPECFRRSPSQD